MDSETLPPEREDEIEERMAMLLECPEWRWRGRKAARKEAEEEIRIRLGMETNVEEWSEE